MRAIGITASILIHLAIGWLVFGPDLWPERMREREPTPTAEATREEEPAEPGAHTNGSEPYAAVDAREGTASTPGERAAANPQRSAEERRGYEAGRAYFERYGIAGMHEQLFGEDIGRELRRPVAQAWQSLSERARNGDDAAAHALSALHGECRAAASQRPGWRDRWHQSMTKGLDDFDRGFVSAYLHGENAYQDGRARECAAAGIGEASIDAPIRDRLAALGTDAPPRDPSSPTDFWADFSALFGDGFTDVPRPSSAAAQGWIERIRSRTPMSDAEFQAMHAVAWDDPALLALLAASCAPDCEPGVDRFEWIAERDRAAWGLRAAQFGITPAHVEHANRLRAAGDEVGALAWYQYAQWLEREGCSPLGILTLQSAGVQAQSIRAGLAPAEIKRAQAQSDALAREFGARALTLRPCPGAG